MKLGNTQNLHAQVAKLQQSLLFIVAVSTVISVFCLVSAKSLLSQGSYQRHVIAAREKAVKQLQSNVNSANQLETYYNQVFENSGPINIIGGKNDSSPTAVPPDGDNARIVLDALPSSYDFPALVTSMSKILTSDNVTSPSVGGTDDSSNQSNKPTSNPQAIPILIPISGTADYGSLQKLINDLQRSIRPYDITNLQIAGNLKSMTFNIQMNTYYQPAKTLDAGTQVIKK